MLEGLLGSKTRAGILSALLEDPARPLHLRELVRRSGGSVSGVQREVERLEAMGLIRSRAGPVGKREFVLETEHPFADPLAGLVAAEGRVAYMPRLAADVPGLRPRLNPRVRGLAGAIADAARSFGATRAALFGSATESDVAVVPHDLDVSVRFDPEDPRSRAELVFGLREELGRLTGMPVDLVESDAVDNPYLLRELAGTEVVLYEDP